MRSCFTLFQKTFAYFLVCLFTFTIVSNCFPQEAYAETTSLPPLPSEAQLRDEILMTGKSIELMGQRLLQEYEIQKPKPLFEAEKLLPGVQEGRYCLQCHSDSASPAPNFFPQAPGSLQIPDFLNDPFFLAPRAGNSHWNSHSPEQKFELLLTEMQTLKTKVQQYLMLENAPIELQVTFIKIYLGALTQYLLTAMVAYPLSNPFDTLDETWHLTLPPNRMAQMKATVCAPETFKTTKDTFATLIRLEDNQVFFSDTFKIAIELSSFLRQQNEAAWLNILKLQTVQYLAKQLLKINDTWSTVGSKNQEFFGQLSHHFRSLNHSFGSLLQDQERKKQTNFNHFLGDHLSIQKIPTVITAERYKDLVSHAPRMWEAIGNRFGDYFEQSHFDRTEKEATSLEIKKALYLYSFSLAEYEPRELARWIKNKILEIKKKFFHDQLEYHFLMQNEMTAEDAEPLEQKYLAEYEKELTIEMILQWLATFDTSVPAAVKSAVEFLKLSAQVEGAQEQIAQIDEQIQALLLYDFNKSVSFSYEVLEGREGAHLRFGLADRWHASGMEKEEMGSMVPYPPDPAIPDLMPVEKFPKIKPIEMDPTNFGVLMATIISSIGNNIFLIKHIDKFTKAKTKEELLTNYQSLLDQVQTMLNNTTIPKRDPKEGDKIHEKEKLKEALKALEKLGLKINRLDPKNTETLDDFFATTKEKVEFLKTKRAILINVFRTLAIPMESGTGNANRKREEKIYLHHLQELKKQDGVLLSEVREFLGDNASNLEQFYKDASENSFAVPQFIKPSDYYQYYEQFEQARQKRIKEFFKPEEVEEALHQNAEILAELRYLENELRYFHDAYVHPEYFMGAKGNLLSPRTLEQLTRVQRLREKRKTAYLDKGGENLDEWLKGYLSTLMLRQALITQDLLIRKNIYKVVNAKSIDEIKEFVLDPYILDQALKMVEQEYPAQMWRVTAFRKMHTDMMDEVSHNFLDNYFDSSGHSAVFWSLVTLQLILLFIPGAQLGAVAIGYILLTDVVTQTGYELFIRAPRSYHMIQNKEDFYLSSTTPEDIIASGGGPGGNNSQDFEKMREDVFWQQAITAGTAPLIFPWARFETKRALQLFHAKTNWFVGLKIPLYAKNLGIEAGTPLTLSLVHEKMAQRLSISSQEFLNLEAPKLIELTLSKLGKEEGAQFLQMVQFFNQTPIAKHLWLTELSQFHQALATLGFEEGMPTVEEARQRAQEMLRRNSLTQGRPSLPPESQLYLETQRQEIEDALRFLETNPNILDRLSKNIPR